MTTQNYRWQNVSWGTPSGSWGSMEDSHPVCCVAVSLVRCKWLLCDVSTGNSIKGTPFHTPNRSSWINKYKEEFWAMPSANRITCSETETFRRECITHETRRPGLSPISGITLLSLFRWIILTSTDLSFSSIKRRARLYYLQSLRDLTMILLGCSDHFQWVLWYKFSGFFFSFHSIFFHEDVHVYSEGIFPLMTWGKEDNNDIKVSEEIQVIIIIINGYRYTY